MYSIPNPKNIIEEIKNIITFSEKRYQVVNILIKTITKLTKLKYHPVDSEKAIAVLSKAISALEPLESDPMARRIIKKFTNQINTFKQDLKTSHQTHHDKKNSKSQHNA